MRKATLLSLLFAAFFVFLSRPVIAQTTGSISGEVRDEKQAVIPNATVTVALLITACFSSLTSPEIEPVV